MPHPPLKGKNHLFTSGNTPLGAFGLKLRHSLEDTIFLLYENARNGKTEGHPSVLADFCCPGPVRSNVDQIPGYQR